MSEISEIPAAVEAAATIAKDAAPEVRTIWDLLRGLLEHLPFASHEHLQAAKALVDEHEQHQAAAAAAPVTAPVQIAAVPPVATGGWIPPQATP